MSSQITVFRSADESAAEDAAKVQEMLEEQGIPAVLLDDHAPEVPAGAYEVQVAEENRARAEEAIAQFSPVLDMEEVDPSHALDMVTVFRSAGATAEMEAMSVQAVLEADGISAMLIGDSRYPNFPQEVRVAQEDETRAKRLLEAALAAGPAGAEEAERAGEKAPESL